MLENAQAYLEARRRARVVTETADRLLGPMGAELRAARELAGMTQREVGRAVGVSFVAVQHWESGTKRPSEQNLERLLQVLGCAG